MDTDMCKLCMCSLRFNSLLHMSINYCKHSRTKSPVLFLQLTDGTALLPTPTQMPVSICPNPARARPCAAHALPGLRIFVTVPPGPSDTNGRPYEAGADGISPALAADGSRREAAVLLRTNYAARNRSYRDSCSNNLLDEEGASEDCKWQ